MRDFPKQFVDAVRESVDLIAYVQRFHDLRKAGAAEYVDRKNPSLTFNQIKRIWSEFGSNRMGGKKTSGDVIDYEMARSGCSFTEAVETLASFAGIKLPAEYERDRKKKNGSNGHHQEEPPPPTGPDDYGGAPAGTQAFRPKGADITRTHDYTDRDGTLIYQVCRREFVKDGKRRKTFFQRRPVPGEDGNWINGLKGGVYLRRKDGDFVVADDDKLRDFKWRNAQQMDVPDCPHMLYRLGELMDECELPEDERRPIFIAEGEKDCDTLAAWGCVATTNSGGAKNWSADFPPFFAGCDVVILVDNDDAGRAHGDIVASSIKPYASRVRLLDWKEHWPNCAPKSDVTDWKERNGGSLEWLCEIVDGLEGWRPRKPASMFGAIHFSELDLPGPELEWLVKGIVTRGDVSIMYGNWGAGKSFLAVDMGMAIARGSSWFGRRTAVGSGELVVYQAGEGALGVKNRLRAYRQHHHIMEPLPFALLSQRVNFFVSDKDALALIEEIKSLQVFYGGRCAMLILDTFAAMSPGADENSGRDVGPVLERCRKIANTLGCHVMIIDHVNKAGEALRGWSGKEGNVDTSIRVEENLDEIIEQPGDRDGTPIPRTVRRWKLVKQKDQMRGAEGKFTLHAINLEQDKDGDWQTSAIVGALDAQEEAESKGAVTRGWAVLPKDEHITLFRCLDQTIRKRGRPPPPEVKAPPSAVAITKKEWQDAYHELSKGHFELDPAQINRLNSRIYRSQNVWVGMGLIETADIWVWRTGKKVHKVDRREYRRQEPQQEQRTTAPGEDAKDVEDILARDQGLM